MAQAGALALAHDALLPRPPGGNAPGAVLALLVHAGLLAALSFSVDWRAQTPDAVSAELWASVPVAAAPAAPEPAPTPPAPPPPEPARAPPPPQAAPQPAEPDIATQRAEQRRKAEAERKQALAAAEAELKKARAEAEHKRVAEAKQRADEEKKKRDQAAAAAARASKAEDERLARQREENLRRMMSQAGGTATGPATGSGTAAQSAAPSKAYTGRLIALIRGNLVYTGEMPVDNNAAEVEVSAAASGTIIARRLVKSSGHKEWDEAVLRAIDRTPTLPRDVDGRVPSRLLIAFRPRE